MQYIFVILFNLSWFICIMIEKRIENGLFQENFNIFPLFFVRFFEFAKIWSKKYRKRLISSKFSIFFLKFSLVLVIMARFDWKKHRERIISTKFQSFSSFLPYLTWFFKVITEKASKPENVDVISIVFLYFYLVFVILPSNDRKSIEKDNFNLSSSIFP